MSHGSPSGLTLSEYYAANPITGHGRKVLEIVERDGPQNVMLPSTLLQWQSTGTAIPVPDYYDRMQMTSGVCVEDVQGSDLTAIGTPEYAQAVTDWDASFVRLGEAVGEGFSAAAGSRWNTNVQSVFGILLYKHTAAASTSVVCRLAGGGGYMSITDAGVLRLHHSGSPAIGSTNYLLVSTVVPIVIEYILGTGVLGHSGSGVYRFSTDREQASTTWEVIPDDTKGYGSVSGLQSPSGLFGPAMWWIGSKAEALSALTPKVVLQTFGWSVTGY